MTGTVLEVDGADCPPASCPGRPGTCRGGTRRRGEQDSRDGGYPGESGEISMTSGFVPTLLQGRTTLLTGASSGIGAILATMLAAHGSQVALLARSEKELRLLAEQIEADGGRAVAVPGDLTDAASVRAAVRSAEEQLGPIDRLVHCAGEARNQAFLCDQDEDQWMATLDINLLGPSGSPAPWCRG
ncbi:SDR family NAD(P)-dependent oxidoreductase [Streptomyces sp. M10(2022)]